MSSKIMYRLDLSVGYMDVFYDVDCRPDDEAVEMEYEKLRYAPFKMLQFKLDGYIFSNDRFHEAYLGLVRELEKMTSGKGTDLEFRYLRLANYGDKNGPFIDLGFYNKKDGSCPSLDLSIDFDGTAEFTFTDSANGFSPNVYHVKMGYGKIVISENTPFSKRIMDFRVHNTKKAHAIVTEYR